jgi:hypothetical protein
VFPLLPATILSDVLWAILAAPQPRTHTTEFVFEWTTAAATHIFAVIRRYGGNLRAALAAQPFSTLSPGSEFRLAHQLAPLLSRHPYGRLLPSGLQKVLNSPLSTFPTCATQ